MGQSERGRHGRRKPASDRKVTRYEFDGVTEPRTPKTGHTGLLGEELVVSLPLDCSGCSHGLELGRVANDGDELLVVDMDPVLDPLLLWAGKRNRRDAPLLPLQRNEVVAESR